MGTPEAVVLVSESTEATEALAEALGRALPAGAVLALRGEMGSGKTAFVRGLARGLGVAGRVTSPTFTLMQEYAGRVPLYHFDAWMSGRESVFLQGGGAEYLYGAGVCAVEWAERVEAFLPRPRLEVRLAHLGPERRELRLALVPGDGAAADEERALARALARLPRPNPGGTGEPPPAAGVGEGPCP